MSSLISLVRASGSMPMAASVCETGGKLFQSADPMAEVVGKLSHLELLCVDENAKPYFRDLLDHVKRVETMMPGLRDVITFVFEANNVLDQQLQGTSTRQLAAWAAILAVPTVIAGI